ncbi:hypothetical protein CRE_19431 [Caenorhabditis remanei]|uniref:Uncharacterized protein n=1 Tax=Caenorhabditis remanei TaxID=31234 RepID=E3NA19_CAERE|nr:hypothetical protein CRE_19431 [Caenorhabditis remanei]
MAANNNVRDIPTLQDIAGRIALREKRLNPRPKTLTEKEMLTYDYFGFQVATKIYNIWKHSVKKSLTRLCRIELVAHLELSPSPTSPEDIKLCLSDPADLYQARGYSLSHLYLSGTGICSTICTRKIGAAFRNLKCLKFVGITTSPRDIDKLCGRLPRLIQLNISETKVPKITNMGSMTSLKFLIMRDIISCPRETWINLGSAPQLEYLDISQQTSRRSLPDITQDFLSSGAVLKKLKTLDCSKTKVTEECLTQLKRRHDALETVIVLDVEAVKSADIDGLFLVNTATLKQSLYAMKYCTLLRRKSDLKYVIRDILELHMKDNSLQSLSDRVDEYLSWIHRIMDEFSDENDMMQISILLWNQLCNAACGEVNVLDRAPFETDMNRFGDHMLLAMDMFKSSTPENIHVLLWDTMKFGSHSDAFRPMDPDIFCYISAIYITAVWERCENSEYSSLSCLNNVRRPIEVMLACTKKAKEEFDPSKEGDKTTPLAEHYLDLFFKELFGFFDMHSGIVRDDGKCEGYTMICTIFIRLMRRSEKLRENLHGIGAIEQLLNHLRVMRTEEVLEKMTTQKQNIPKVQRKVTKMIREICILPDITDLGATIFDTRLLINIMNDENTDVNNEFYVASICSTYAFCLELKGVESAEEDMIEYLNARALGLSKESEFSCCNVNVDAYLKNTIIQEILQRSKITGVVYWAMEVIAILINQGHNPSLSYKRFLPPLLPFVRNYETDDEVLLKMKANVLEWAD